MSNRTQDSLAVDVFHWFILFSRAGWCADPLPAARRATPAAVSSASVEQALGIRVPPQEHGPDHYTSDQDALLLQPKSSQGTVFDEKMFLFNQNISLN